jgi:lysozyme
VTLFLPDWSNNNWGGPSWSAAGQAAALAACAEVIREGYAGIIHKVSEGDDFADPYWQPVRDWCNANGVPVMGYAYVRVGDAAGQAQTFVANGGGSNAMLDFEANSGDISNFWAVVNAFNAAGVNIALSYIPHWYWQQIGSPDLTGVPGLISSAYDYEGNYASTEYDESGGDNGAGWTGYGGANPVIWQFTDGALMAGISADANAFRGALADLQELFGAVTAPPAPPPAPPTPEVQVTQPQDVLNDQQGVDQNGNPEWWNVVYGRSDAVFGQLVTNPQKGPWNEPYPNGVTELKDSQGNTLAPGGVWDHGAHAVLAAEALSFRYVDSTGRRVDLQSMLMAFWELFLATHTPEQVASVITLASTPRQATS